MWHLDIDLDIDLQAIAQKTPIIEMIGVLYPNLTQTNLLYETMFDRDSKISLSRLPYTPKSFASVLSFLESE